MRKIIILIVTTAFAQAAVCQQNTVLMDSAKNEMYRINKVFDSSEYLGFDLEILYKSDSANVTMDTEKMEGNYVLNKKNIYYQMGSSIYLQTDSFAYNIYPDEHTMIMTKNFISENSNAFPLRNFVDSMMYYYASSYAITLDTIAIDTFETVKRIRFNRINLQSSDDVMKYNYFYIDYSYDDDQGNYRPIKFEFSFDEIAQSITLDSLGNNINPNTYVATKTVTMNFYNFRPMSGSDIFNDASYVIYNRQRKIYEPTGKYREYQFTSSGFDNEDDDAEFYREEPIRQN
jgi:hypothetical protein